MSYTELFEVPAQGELKHAGEFENAFRGAFLVWDQMGKHYLGVETALLMARNMKPVWDLSKDPSIPVNDRIVMMSTFDNVMVKRENLPRLIKAIRDYATRFDPGHLLLQVTTLEELADNQECFAVCWNQTSVNCDTWRVPDILECGHYEEYRYYDVSRDEGHWFLFSEELEKEVTK